MRYRILPYKRGSASAKALAVVLGGKILRLEGSTFKPKDNDVIVNWGSSQYGPLHHIYAPEGAFIRTLNSPISVREITDKLKFFNLMAEKGVDCVPQFWTSREDIPADAYPVVCRTVLCGHSGAGVVVASSPAEVVDAPLYTKYIKKQDEYRIHVGLTTEGPCLISVQKKARRIGFDNPNWQVRNHQNGFVYKREGVNPPDCVIQAAYKAFDASGLDFGAVDVIYNAHQEKAYVLEINTAPGLEGQTVQDYADFFRSLSA